MQQGFTHSFGWKQRGKSAEQRKTVTASQVEFIQHSDHIPANALSSFYLFFFCYQRGCSPVRTLLHSSFAKKKKRKEKQEKQQKLGRGKGNSVRISENSNIFPLTASFKGMKTHWLHGGGNRMRNNRKLEKVTAKKMKINNVHLNSSI